MPWRSENRTYREGDDLYLDYETLEAMEVIDDEFRGFKEGLVLCTGGHDHLQASQRLVQTVREEADVLKIVNKLKEYHEQHKTGLLWRLVLFLPR